jgi:branched-chain amino acid transport system substrate-binding protein
MSLRTRRFGRAVTVGTVVACVIGVSACSSSSSSSSATSSPESSSSGGGTFTVGAVVPLSGSLSTLGIQLLAGLKAQADYLNEHGGVLGRTVKIISVDDGSNVQQGLSATQQLVQNNQLNLFVPDPVFAASQLAFSKNVLTVDACSEAVCGNGTEYPLGFTTSTGSLPQVQAELLYAKSLGYSRVGVVGTDDADGQQFASYVKQEASHYGVTVVAQRAFPATATTASPEVESVKAANPQAVLIWAVGPPTAVLLDAFQSLAWSVPVIAIPSINTGENLSQLVPSSVLSQVTCLCFRFASRPLTSTGVSPVMEPLIQLAAKYIGKTAPNVQTETFGAEPLAEAAYAYQQAGSLSASAAAKELETIPQDTKLQAGQTWVFIGTNPAFSASNHAPNASLYSLFSVTKLTTPYVDGTWAGPDFSGS